jgi:hypothetical protein
MALTSPGVQVSVIDESFYTPAEPGTTPIIFVASAENKLNGGGTGVAPGTLKENAGKVYLMTSQRDLVETFGDPTFVTDVNNNVVQGGEQNEYGLQAAYSYLGVSNRAYVVRADVDLNSLNASSSPTTANPKDGTWWLDTQTTEWGIFEWDGSAATTETGQTFIAKTPIVITDKTDLVGGDATNAPGDWVGSKGDYAVVTTSNLIKFYYKNTDDEWVIVGSPEWSASIPTVEGTNAISSTIGNIGDTFVINASDSSAEATQITLSGNTLSSLVTDINNAAISGVTAEARNNKLVLLNDRSSSDTIQLVDGAGQPLAAAGIEEGFYLAPKLQVSKHTDVPLFKTNDSDTRPSGSVWIKTTTPNLGADWRVKQFNGDTEIWNRADSPLYATNHSAIYALDRTGGGANIPVGTVYVQTNAQEQTNDNAYFKIFVKRAGGATTITSNKITASTFAGGAYNITMQESLKSQEALDSAKTVSFTATGQTTDAQVFAAGINAAGFTNIVASVDSQNRVVITHTLGGEIRMTDTDNALTFAGFAPYNATTKTGTLNLQWEPGETDSNPEKLVASLWSPLVYTASDDAPTALAADGALWYSSTIDEVDMLVHNGTTWVGINHSSSPYYNVDSAQAPDAQGPIISATEPENGDRSDNGNLVTGDIWIDTSDLENYPQVYIYNATLTKWVLIDNTDQTTENGILFADARYNTSGANSDEAGDIEDLGASNYLDPDAPDPALYPKGMLLWNLRRSGFNVRRFERNYIDVTDDNERFGDEAMEAYYPHRWVTESGNQADGAGTFGRKAQRKVVVQALQALMNSNQDIRDDESRTFNLIASPGYPELIGEMITLNFDRGLTAFVVGDTPFRLTSDATSLENWATNQELATEDNDDGLVTSDEYLGVYYPSGLTSDNVGNNVVVPASHMVLRTFALNDQVAYPWFAPAGTRRGGVTNASSVGYINAEDEFVSIALNEGQRDTLYRNNVNPITFLNGAGLVVFGQKTRARNASALDRVNVARLVVYLRSQLNQLAKPYLFEPNDKITRDEIKGQVESLMVELVGLRALYDFLVVCDETNNTPARIDRNELYVDIAIEPVKAIEFIYIPLRIKNTGEIAGL